jgi:hypothetical protein
MAYGRALCIQWQIGLVRMAGALNYPGRAVAISMDKRAAPL